MKSSSIGENEGGGRGPLMMFDDWRKNALSICGESGRGERERERERE